nr:hypothetical protein [Candidatus Sigynarchaeota archaeon]
MGADIGAEDKHISKDKHILVKHEATGEIYDGDIAKEIAGIPRNAKGTINPPEGAKYKIFIQSTSNNRVLQSGTLFIYDARDDIPKDSDD